MINVCRNDVGVLDRDGVMHVWLDNCRRVSPWLSLGCSCCEADGMQLKRTRNLTTKRPSVRFSNLTDADINFFEKGNTDLCELQQNTWAPLPKPLVVDSGAGETVMPVDWLTSHPLTESDGTQQPMAAKCTMKDKENWMFAFKLPE